MLLPGITGRYEHHLVETASIRGLAGGHEMPQVRRIEGPSEDPDSTHWQLEHARILSRHPAIRTRKRAPP
jgi:hypothetical protein